MSLAVIGSRVKGIRSPLNAQALSMSTPHQIYEVEMHIQGNSDSKAAAEALSNLHSAVPECEALYIQVSDTKVVMQITGSPFDWAAVFDFLPSALGYLGIAVIILIAFVLLRELPIGLIEVGLIGGFLAFVMPKLDGKGK